MIHGKTAIFYFSGTGNTELIAKLFAKALSNRGQDVDLYRVEHVLQGIRSVDYEAYNLIGIGHPVLGFGASSIVERFVEQLPDCKGTPVFVFKTASSPHYVNHGASNPLLHTLRKKGYSPFHNSILAMPCNFYMKYDDRLNKQLYQAAQCKVELFADEIVNEIPRNLRIHPALERLLRMVYYWEERQGGKYFAKGLRVTDACTLCLKCVRSCPKSNITNSRDGIVFSQNCLLCMRCIYSCPQKAIRATRLKSSVVDPYTGGPNLQALMKDSENDGRFVTPRSRGYYKHFIKYLEE